MSVRFAAVLCCITAGTLYSQRAPAPYYEDTKNIPLSPEVRGDRTVTFRLFAPKASEVDTDRFSRHPGGNQEAHAPSAG